MVVEDFKLPWKLFFLQAPLQEVPKNGPLPPISSSPSLKQIALTYGVILALDFTSNG